MVAFLLFNPMRSNPPSDPSESVLTLRSFLSGRSFLPDMMADDSRDASLEDIREVVGEMSLN